MATTPSNNAALKRLIREAGFSFQTVGRRQVEVVFGGPYRPWTILTNLNEHWLSLGAYICRVPEAPGCRAELSELMLRLNEENSLAKYSYHCGDVVLQLQYRGEHLDAAAMNRLIGLICSCANDDYPRIMRVLTGDEALKRLEKQFLEKD